MMWGKLCNFNLVFTANSWGFQSDDAPRENGKKNIVVTTISWVIGESRTSKLPQVLVVGILKINSPWANKHKYDLILWGMFNREGGTLEA